MKHYKLSEAMIVILIRQGQRYFDDPNMFTAEAVKKALDEKFPELKDSYSQYDLENLLFDCPFVVKLSYWHRPADQVDVWYLLPEGFRKAF